MRKTLEKGAFVEWLLSFFAISIVIFAILIPKGVRFDISGWNQINNRESSNQDGSETRSYTSGTNSGGTRTLRIERGNSKYENDPMSEYVVIENNGSNQVNITGYRLENGKSARSYAIGSQYLHYTSDVGMIPQGTKIVSPDGRSHLENIILKRGERAIIISGGPGNLTSYTLTSFKENSCTGYLDETYEFPRGLEKSCVRPAKEVGYSTLDTSCKRYVDQLQTCHTPKYGGRNNDNEICRDCVDGEEGLSSMCIAYVKSHFSYEGCLANHIGDKDFEGKTWYVYLHRPWEMWANEDEKISLFDPSGVLVDSVSY